jgi:biopolymer transport protein ExbD
MAESANNVATIQLVDEDESPLNSTINTTPLVDIMLVMLIIFLITVPVVVGTVEVQLPEERNKAVEVKPENVYLFVDAPGNVYWNTYRLPNDGELTARLAEAARRQPQPEVHISGDVNSEYLNVGRVVEMVQKAGILRIAFITKKPPGA